MKIKGAVSKRRGGRRVGFGLGLDLREVWAGREWSVERWKTAFGMAEEEELVARDCGHGALATRNVWIGLVHV